MDVQPSRATFKSVGPPLLRRRGPSDPGPNSARKMVRRCVWSGMPVNIVYVPHEENESKPPAEGVPRIQYGEGYDAAGTFIGHGREIFDMMLEDGSPDTSLQPHENILLMFSRCPTCVASQGGSWLPMISLQILGSLVAWMPVARNCSVFAILHDMTLRCLKRIEIEIVAMVRHSITLVYG